MVDVTLNSIMQEIKMKKYLILFALFTVSFSELVAGSPVKTESVGIVGTLFPLAAYSALNLVPSNIEFIQHKKHETSFSSIYWFGFIGGAVGYYTGRVFTTESYTLFASIVSGMVAGHKLGHYSFVRRSKRNLKVSPYFIAKKLNLQFSITF